MGYDVQTKSVIATIFINLIIGGIFTIGFEYYRRNDAIFAPKSKWNDNPRVPNIEPARGVFAWVPQLLAINDEDIIAIAGLDAYVMIRFVRMCFFASCYCSLGALFFLIPVYYNAPDNGIVGINMLSMAHLKAQAGQLWVSVFFTYFFVGTFLYHLYYEYQNFARCRREYFRNGDPRLPAQMQFTILVEQIPKEYCTSQKLKELFEELFPNRVHSAAMVVSAPELENALRLRKNACASLENAVAAKQAHKDKESPEMTTVDGEASLLTSCCCRCCLSCCYKDVREHVDAIEFWTARLDKMNAVVKELQSQAIRCANGDESLFEEKAAQKKKYGKKNKKDDAEGGGGGCCGKGKGDVEEQQPATSSAHGSSAIAATDAANVDDGKGKKDIYFMDKAKTEYRIVFGRDSMSNTGLVTFRTRKCQVVANSMPIICAEYPYIIVTAASAPTDFIWENMPVDMSKMERVHDLVNITLTVGLLFWGIILAGVAAISSLSNLEKLLPFLKQINGSAKAILSGQLPVVALMIFVSLLAMILTFFVKNIKRLKTISAVQAEVFVWFFKYQMANVLLILIAGSLFNALQQFIKKPQIIFAILGSSLPQVAVFFINYSLTQLLSGIPSMFFNFVGLIIYGVYKLIYGEAGLTRRTLVEGPLSPSSMNYGVVMPGILFSAFVMFVYWVIAPIVLLVLTVYFGLLILAYKYQVIFVCVANYEGGGQFWYNLYYYTMVGIMVSVITMIGFLSIKEGAAQVPVTLPLVFIVYYMWGHTERKFKTLSQFLPFSEAVKADNSARVGRPPVAGPSKQEMMKMNKGEISARSEEAKDGLMDNDNMRGEEKTSLGEDHPLLPPASSPEHDKATAKAMNEPAPAGADGGMYDYNDEHLDLKYCCQPAMTASPMTPYPYRVQDIPLLTETGQLNAIYYHDDPEEWWAKECAQRLETGGQGIDIAAPAETLVNGEPQQQEQAQEAKPPPTTGSVDLTPAAEQEGIAMTDLGASKERQDGDDEHDV